VSFLEPNIEDFRRDENGNLFFISLIELPEGIKGIKCKSTVEFYTLKVRTVKICKENLEPMFGIWYAIYSPPIVGDTASDKYYPRELRPTDNYEENIKDLRRYVKDGNLYLLLDKTFTEKITETLERLYRAYHKKDGKLDYRKQYIPLMENSLALEHYVGTGKKDPNDMSKVKAWENKIKLIYSLI